MCRSFPHLHVHRKHQTVKILRQNWGLHCVHPTQRHIHNLTTELAKSKLPPWISSNLALLLLHKVFSSSQLNVLQIQITSQLLVCYNTHPLPGYYMLFSAAITIPSQCAHHTRGDRLKVKGRESLGKASCSTRTHTIGYQNNTTPLFSHPRVVRNFFHH